MTHFPRYIPLKVLSIPETRDVSDMDLIKFLGWVILATSLLWGIQPLCNAEPLPTLRITGRQLSKAAQEGVIANWKKAGFEATLDVVRLPPDVIIQGHHAVIRVPCAEAKPGPLGNVGILVEILDDGVVVRDILVGLRVTLVATVAVAARPLARHELLRENDVRWQRVTLSTSPTLFIKKDDSYIGKRTTQAILPESLLAQRWIEEEPLVKKGQEVNVTTSEGSIQVSIQAIAERDGGVRDIVKVRSLEGGRRLDARVIEAGHLELAEGPR